MESGISLKESGIPQHLESRIQVLLTNTGIQYLESGIYSVESRIQDCPRFPYMGRPYALLFETFSICWWKF